MLSQRFKDVLRQVSPRFEEMGLRWSVIGSTNMALHGMDVEPSDLDIVTNVEGAREIREEFHGDVEEEMKRVVSDGDSPDYHEMTLEIQDVEVHVIGGYEDDVYFGKIVEGRTEGLRSGDLEVPCLTLRAEMDAYRSIGRGNKAERIKEYLIDLNEGCK
ncbi:MAG: nucleotidyltransferase domain-containing protein [Candidatus Aenigmatarchaeota archaeon]